MTAMETLLPSGCPATLADVIDAARLPLDMYQRNAYVAWRTDRWWNDECLAAEITRDRHDWKFYRQFAYGSRFDTIFGLPVALDILVAALPHSPETVIARLDTMGAHAKDTPDDEFAAALDLLDRPGLHRALRESGLPLVEARVALKVVPEDLLGLMFAAGMSADEILDLVYTGGPLPDPAGLRMMAALRAPTDG